MPSCMPRCLHKSNLTVVELLLIMSSMQLGKLSSQIASPTPVCRWLHVWDHEYPKECTECSEILDMWVTHQVLKHKCKRLLSVDDVMKSHNICVFQVLQQRHCGDRDRLFLKHVTSSTSHAFMNILRKMTSTSYTKLVWSCKQSYKIFFFSKRICTFATVPLKL